MNQKNLKNHIEYRSTWRSNMNLREKLVLLLTLLFYNPINLAYLLQNEATKQQFS